MRFQGSAGTISPDKRTIQCLENIWKQWGEIWIWDKKKELSYGAYIEEEIRKGTIIMVCDGSKQPNSDDDIVAAA